MWLSVHDSSHVQSSMRRLQLHARALILRHVLGLMSMNLGRGMQLQQSSSPLWGLAAMTGNPGTLLNA